VFRPNTKTKTFNVVMGISLCFFNVMNQQLI